MIAEKNSSSHDMSHPASPPKEDGGVYIALGANLPFSGLHGAPLLREACRQIRAKSIRLIATSPVYLSEAWPDKRQPKYHNAVLEIDPKELKAQELLAVFLQIEQAFGRDRRVKNAPRTLDIDILDFKNEVIVRSGLPRLVLPHPHMHKRDFVLLPLAKIAPGWRHPILQIPISELLEAVAEISCEEIQDKAYLLG